MTWEQRIKDAAERKRNGIKPVFTEQDWLDAKSHCNCAFGEAYKEFTGTDELTNEEAVDATHELWGPGPGYVPEVIYDFAPAAGRYGDPMEAERLRVKIRELTKKAIEARREA